MSDSTNNNIFDKILNLKYYSDSNMSLLKAFLLFYVLIASNFTKNLYSGQLIDYLSTNRWVQHLIGFILMLVIIVEIGNVRDPWMALIYTSIAYLWFILSTKLDLAWNLAILALLVFGFLYENQLINKEIKSAQDGTLDKSTVENIVQKNNRTKTYLLSGLFCITLVGIISYFFKKQVQYGGDFDAVKFLFEANKRYKIVK